MHKFGNGNPNVMMIGHNRMFYNGLLGNSYKARELGSLTIYVAPVGTFKITYDGKVWHERTIVAVPAYTSHMISAEADLITTVCIEPETVSERQLHQLERQINTTRGGELIVKSVREAKSWLQSTRDNNAFTTQDFDALFLNEPLEGRKVDDRIARTLSQFRTKDNDVNLSAESCALSNDLSMSRFLHLFKEQTGLRFRSYRMWKRARKFLDHANRHCNLTYLALDLGYPDSTHFSHSIRRIYGLKPRSLLEGSRSMEIFTGQGYQGAER